MDTSGVHRRRGVWEVERHENQKNEIRALVAAGLGIREGTENLGEPQKESGEDYARRILEFLKTVKKS